MPVDEQARHQNHGVESDDREHEAFELDARLVNGHRRPLLVSVHSHAALAATVVCAAWTCPAVMVLFTAANTRVMFVHGHLGAAEPALDVGARLCRVPVDQF
jgi:hypothetical protein